MTQNQSGDPEGIRGSGWGTGATPPLPKAGGVEANWIDSDALRTQFPSLNPDSVGGTSYPAGQVEPYKFSLAMAPTPPHQKPVMGRLPGWKNAYVASRFGGDGVCMSPATGELMAELIATGRAPLRARRMFERLAPGAGSE